MQKVDLNGYDGIAVLKDNFNGYDRRRIEQFEWKPMIG